jgi:hypothetical protein
MAADTLDTFSAEAENLSTLGLGWYFNFSVAIECGNFNFSTQRSSGKTDWHLTVKIIVIALKYRVG